MLAQALPPLSPASACAACAIGVVAGEQLIAGGKRASALGPDQAAADDRHALGAHAYSCAYAPSNSKSNAELRRPGRRHRLPGVLGPRSVDEQEAASAGTHELAADHAAAAGEHVEAIDVLVGHARRAAALVLPVLVHEFCVALEVSAAQELAALPAELLGAVQVREHLLVSSLRALILIGKDLRGRTSLAGVEQQQLVTQLAQDSGAELQRLDLDAAVGAERVRADPSVRSHVGILLAHRLFEHVDLDLARCLGERARCDRGPARVREALQQADGVGARGAHARPRGDIRHRGDLERVAAPVAKQALAQDRVPDLADLVDLLHLGVLHAIALLEDRVGEHVDVLVDRPGHQEAAVLAVVGGEVGTAASERDPQRRAAEDHAHRAAPPRNVGAPASSCSRQAYSLSDSHFTVRSSA